MRNKSGSIQNTYQVCILATIRQIRQARHDMRHHFHVLQSLAEQENLKGILNYLAKVQGDPLHFQEGWTARDTGRCPAREAHGAGQV
mgnify:CR=1 FL=1